MGLPGAPEGEVDVHEAKRMVDDDEVRVVDVRTQFQFPAMPGAAYVPLTDILTRPKDVLETDKPILFICNVGQTSGVAMQMAHAMGIADAYNMMGGMEAWEQAGYGTEDPPAESH